MHWPFSQWQTIKVKEHRSYFVTSAANFFFYFLLYKCSWSKEIKEYPAFMGGEEGIVANIILKHLWCNTSIKKYY